MELIDQIIKHRENAGISKYKLAKMSGVPARNISQIEKGFGMNLATFVKLCQALGLEIVLKAKKKP